MELNDTKNIDPIIINQERLIIEKLIQIRRSKRLSQQRLSELSNLSQNTVAYIENGRRHPTLITILTLCKALEINPATLLNVNNNNEEIKKKITNLLETLQ
ncbi:MAG: helix-turn-helix domain-containing protein [Sphaerochaetaceae bacterium]|nr:helix-turn-helix domain-containing protein [Sphaerochaetaceae bacterium]